MIHNLKINDIILLNNKPCKIQSIENAPSRGHVIKKYINCKNIFNGELLSGNISSNNIQLLNLIKTNYKIMGITLIGNICKLELLTELDDLMTVQIPHNYMLEQIINHFNKKEIFVSLLEYNGEYSIDSFRFHIFG